MYVCVYIYIYIHTYVCIYIYTYYDLIYYNTNIILIQYRPLPEAGAAAGPRPPGHHRCYSYQEFPTPGLHYKIPVFSDPAAGKS